jgi:hypothetical protein
MIFFYHEQKYKAKPPEWKTDGVNTVCYISIPNNGWLGVRKICSKFIVSGVTEIHKDYATFDTLDAAKKFTETLYYEKVVNYLSKWMVKI